MNVPFLSNQFKLKKYLGLSEDEIRENEELWRQENDVQKFESMQTDSTGASLSSIGIRPEPNVDVDVDADLPTDALPTDPGMEAGLDSLAAPDTPPTGGTV